MANTFNPQEHMMKLKNKDYLQVMWRLVWFREEHPDWCINTVLAEHDADKQVAVFRAEIIEPKTEHVVSTGWGSECSKDFHDYLEKAETKAVGRALAMLGYGTQFAPELDEGERIVDSPVERKAQRNTATSAKLGKEMGLEIAATFMENDIKPEFVCKLYNIKNMADMTEKQMQNAMAHLTDIKKKQEEMENKA